MEKLPAPGTRNHHPPAPVGQVWRSGLFWRMMSGGLVAFVTLLITVGLSLAVLFAIADQNNQMQKVFESAGNVEQFAAGLQGMYQGLDLLRAGDFNSRFYDVQSDRANTIRRTKQLDEIRINKVLPEDLRSRLGTLLNRYDTLSPQLNDLSRLARTDPSSALLQWRGTYAAQLSGLSDDVNALSTNMSKQVQAQKQTMTQTQETAPRQVIVISLLGLGLGIGLALWVLRSLVWRIAAITGDIQRLARGDLTLPARFRRSKGAQQPGGLFSDEVGTLEHAYVETLGILRRPLQQIQQDASRISASSAEISEAANYQAASSNQQATSITEVTVTVEQLNQTAQQIADAAASVAAAAEQALLSAGHGQEAVRDSIIGMAMIRSRVNDITSRILALSSQSQRISEIIDLIDTMAGQTHILALNAAVESAGAGGEIGERFGVVASEVKKLAQRSAAATREVRAVIAQVQAATNAAVMATEDGLKETEKGVGLAHQSGDANEGIIGMVERTTQLANAISLATQQQRTASEQVVATMREIAAGTRLTAAGTRQAAHAAGDLSDIAGDLRAVSTGFHLPATATQPPPTDPPTENPPLRTLYSQETPA